ncbi:alpha/beta fold hydrolase [Flavobacterium hungaricum]|uniref:Alpha/beta hydrolase n=1 Tax=Flavobacterium hungaricum TaxID=2082725 RepID=A0ABR9TGA0_9FLAO|nr:alpha/beta hydrolase [Flavobacterium hungaricum]MBE8724383.1 alpha/beta hydrolase [Flavobacterium hungaricum]
MKTTYHTKKINGVEIFYREAGDKKNPTLLLLHGYPTSSHMFRNLITDLSDKYHLIAPDYPGYGRSEQPPIAEFKYTFENIAAIMTQLLKELDIQKYSLYLMDYGAPIGFRIATVNPEKIDSLIIQNGCAYEEGLEAFWDPFKAYWKDINNKEASNTLQGFHSLDGLKWQYTHNVPNPELISPDNWEIDLRHLERPENNEIQLAMFYDYQTNVVLYPQFQEYFRKYQPETLIVYGKDDYIFPGVGAEAFKKDLKNLEFHLFETGHFALESYGVEIGELIEDFLDRKVSK